MKQIQKYLVLLTLVLAACGSKQVRREIRLKDGQGVDTARIKAAIEALETDSVNIHSVLVEYKGELVAEYYGKGSDRTMAKRYGIGNPFAGETVFDAETLHDVRSASKAVTALLFGLEHYRKDMPLPHEPVLAHYPKLADIATPEKNKITFAHLLTMSSGLEWHEWGRSFLTSDETRLLWKSDTARFVLNKDLLSTPGTAFLYSGGNTAVLADIIVRRTGKPLEEIARAGLFEPLGITAWEWAKDSSERPLAHAGLRLKPRDMLKIGRLVLQKGKWQGKQLIAREWIEQMTRPQIQTPVDFFSGHGEKLGYGYQWWTGTSPHRGSSVVWSAAVGNGGQRICVVPQLNLVIVTIAGDYGEREIQRRVGMIVDAVIAAVP
ncbi:MAG: serine hydrolase [Turneriella sp.]|nr:serine hydrolase [Turneriella sp.]